MGTGGPAPRHAGNRRTPSGPAIDVHAHVVLESVLGAAGPHGPELDDGDPATGRLPCFRVGDYELVGVRYRGTPFMDLDARLAAMDAAGIELPDPLPQPADLLLPRRGRVGRGVLSTAQRRGGRPGRVGPEPAGGLRPAADAGPTPSRRRAAPGGGRAGAARRLPRHRPRPSPRRSGLRRGVGDVHRAGRPRLPPPGARRGRPAAARRAAGPLRRRPVARLPVRGDAGGGDPRPGRRAGPPPRRSTSA